jgi:exodeoxyribonuclease VII large subunit
LFDEERKRELPEFPKTIGIVTSPQAAALRDVLIALRRRAPHIHVILYPAPVQGAGSAEKITTAINTASRRAECDVLLVCRGGGSIEDLWSFNDESVARAIAACSMPVIAGIGHETDFTIADFVADCRAPTPTAAAELAATPRADWIAALFDYADGLTSALRRQLDNLAQTIDWHAHRLLSPANAIKHQQLRLAATQQRLHYALLSPLNTSRHALHHMQQRLKNQLPDTRLQLAQLSQLTRRFSSAHAAQCTHQKQRLASLTTQLNLLAPQRTLERGYAILQDHAGNILRQPQHITAPERYTLRLAGGSAEIDISSVHNQKQDS